MPESIYESANGTRSWRVDDEVEAEVTRRLTEMPDESWRAVVNYTITSNSSNVTTSTPWRSVHDLVTPRWAQSLDSMNERRRNLIDSLRSYAITDGLRRALQRDLLDVNMKIAEWKERIEDSMPWPIGTVFQALYQPDNLQSRWTVVGWDGERIAFEYTDRLRGRPARVRWDPRMIRSDLREIGADDA